MLQHDRIYLKKFPFVYFVGEDDQQKFLSVLRKCRKDLEPVDIEISIRNEKEHFFSARLSILPMTDYRTKKITFRIAVIDLTEIKKAGDKLKESEGRFRMIADASAIMIWMTDENQDLIYMNKARLRFMGKEEGSITNNDLTHMLHPKDKKEFLDKFKNAQKKKEEFIIEIRAKNSNGEYRWIYETVLPRFLANGTFSGFIGSSIDITENKNIRVELQDSLTEKETLLKEIHHRVKNNLQIISSLLNMQAHALQNNEVKAAFQVSQDRIRSMALIHEKLYKTKELKSINMEEYIRDISSQLFQSYKNSENRIDLILDVERIDVGIELAIDFGLILNELITNSLKHAFPNNRDGRILIKMKRSPSKDIELRINDDGVGLPENYNSKSSLGLELIRALVDQHKGIFEIGLNSKTEFFINIPQEEKTSH